MTDYNLIKAALQLGGRVRSSVSLSTGEVFERGAVTGVPLAGAGTAAEVLLSNTHISPRVVFYRGASYLKTSREGVKTKVGGGLRGDVTGFSSASRRRLMSTIAQIRREAALPLFITLTYPAEFPTARESKKHLDAMNKRMRRAFPGAGWIWKLEPQERAAPHYHLLFWGASLEAVREVLPVAWYEIAGGGDEKHLRWHMGLCGYGNKHCVQQVNSFRGVWSYASKYLGKTFEVEGWENAGRFWGVVARQNIPFGEKCEEEIEQNQACTLMRYQRRFSGQRKQIGRSVITFCDADQWISKIVNFQPREVILDT